MTLLEKFESLETKFSCSKLTDAVRALLVMEQDFVDKRRASSLQGILLGLANTFPDERGVISDILSTRTSVRRNVVKTRTEKVGKAVNFSPVNWDDFCPTCGSKSTMKKMDAKKAENNFTVPESLEDLEGAQDWRGILSAFGVETEKMYTLAKESGVKLGNTKDPVKVAQRIYVHMRNEGIA